MSLQETNDSVVSVNPMRGVWRSDSVPCEDGMHIRLCSRDGQGLECNPTVVFVTEETHDGPKVSVSHERHIAEWPQIVRTLLSPVITIIPG